MIPCELKKMFKEWNVISVRSLKKKTWALLFFVVTWFVWGNRNKIIFENGEGN